MTLSDRTPENQQRIITAICDMILSMGFNAMADDFHNKPSYRPKIIAAMSKQVARELGPTHARRFMELARLVA